MAPAGGGVAPLSRAGDGSVSRRLVGTAYFLLFFGVGVWLPYMPLYLRDLGCSGWQIGLVGGLQPMLRWSSGLTYAYVADRWRIRQRLIVGTALAGALWFVPLLFVRRFETALLVLSVISILHGPLVPMLDATVMDHLDRLGGDYGRLRLWGSIGFIAGAWTSAPIVRHTSSAALPWLSFAAAALLVFAVPRLPRAQRGHGSPFTSPWRLLTKPLALFLLAGFLLQVSCGAWGGLFALHTRALGFADSVPGFTFGLAVVAEVLVFYWGRPVLARLDPATMLLWVLLINVVRWGLTAAASTEWVVIGLQIGHVFSFTAFHLAALALLAKLVPVQSTTGGQALYGLVAFGLGGSTGQLLAGALVDHLGTAGVFGLEAAIAAAGVPFALWLLRTVD